MLSFQSLRVKSDGKEILGGVSLTIKRGETHFIMGPNGAGKSTLGFALMGHPNYKIVGGTVSFLGKNILRLAPESRAKLGLFLAFQNPLEFDGVPLRQFLKTSLCEVSGASCDPGVFRRHLEKKLQTLGMNRAFADRYLNREFSGGEKKKSEILQMVTLKPRLAVLDEIDSGLDVDSSKRVIKEILKLKKAERTSLLIITHHARIAKFLKPDFVHIMVDGKIIKTGGKKLIDYIEKYGYKNF